MKSKVPLCGTMISLPVSHRRKGKAPFGGAAPLPGRGDAARNRCARKDARPWPFCNAPYAHVLPIKWLGFNSLCSFSKSCWDTFCVLENLFASGICPSSSGAADQI
jgi:hypothetical protein